MSESINIESKKQSRQKPPLSIVRIIGEILVGFALGSVSLIILLYIGDWLIGTNETGLLFLVIFIYGSPLLYGIGCAVGVYFIGSIGQQTGSFLLSLIVAFCTGLVVLLPSLSLRVIDIPATEIHMNLIKSGFSFIDYLSYDMSYC